MFNKRAFVFAGGVAVSLTLASAASDELAARRLFYQDNQPEVVFRATAVATRAPGTTAKPDPAPAKTTPTTQPVQAAKPAPPRKQQLAQAQKDNQLSDGTKIERPKNFGVRYNLVKVDADGGGETPVSPDTNFKKGDCVAVRIQPNRGGFLYVFNQGTSGKWQPLLPSSEMPEEPNVVRPYQRVAIPTEHCFTLDDPPGEERLFVLVTEKEQDIKNIDEILQLMKKGKDTPQSAPKRGDTLVLAQNRLDTQMKGFQQQLVARDIVVTRVNRPVTKDEPAYSVYLVNAAASSNDHLILEVKLSHK